MGQYAAAAVTSLDHLTESDRNSTLRWGPRRLRCGDVDRVRESPLRLRPLSWRRVLARE